MKEPGGPSLDPTATEARGEIVSIDGERARAVGHEGIAYGEVVALGDDRALVVSLLHDAIELALFDGPPAVRSIVRTGRVLEIPCGATLRGRVVDPLGRPLDGRASLEGHASPRALFAAAPRRMACDFHRGEPLFTGIKRIDLLARLRRGDRRAMYGARASTDGLVGSMMRHQAGGDVVCVYGSIGRTSLELAVLETSLAPARENVTIVAAPRGSSAALSSLVPFAACAIAEGFRDAGVDALLVIDDVDAFADAPSRAPTIAGSWCAGDALGAILERAVLLQRDHGGGSLTALVVLDPRRVEPAVVRAVDAAVDGSFVLADDPLAPRASPTIDVLRSTPVQRFGAPLKGWGGHLHARLRDARARQADEPLLSAFDQPHDAPMAIEEQVVSVYAALFGHAAGVPSEAFPAFEDALLRWLRATAAPLLARIRDMGGCSGDARIELDRALAAFNASRPRA